MTIKRCIVVSLFALSLPVTAFADPKKEAVDAMNWGLQYCKDGLNPDRAIVQVEDYYEKFQARLATAVAADPSIRTWTGTLRGMKVNEAIPKCEKELPAIIAKKKGDLATEDRNKFLLLACQGGGDRQEYERRKAEALKTGPLPADLAQQLAKCEADYAAAAEASKKQDKEFADARAKKEAERAEAAKKEAEEEKKFRASLKGDRRKYYDNFGLPKFDGADIMAAKEWHWIHDKTSQFGVTKPCFTYVRFNGNKKVKEWQSGDSCKW
jgi:hypothetical protein